MAIATQHIDRTTGTTDVTERGARRRSSGRTAGIAYVVAWVAGLALRPTGPALDATRLEITEHYRAHRLAAGVQSVLVHGVAAVALLGVAAAVVAAAVRRGRTARGLQPAALVVVAVSLVQMAAGLALAIRPEAPWLFDAVNRLDGLKMLGLVALLLAGSALFRQGVLPRWLGTLGVVTAAALVPAAIGYGLLWPAPAAAAAVALPLLLVWVCAAGLAAGRG